MAIIAVPDNDELVITSYDLDVPQQVNRSGWTSRSKVVGLPGAESWVASVEIADLATEMAERVWRIFLFGLKGRANIFRLRIACGQRAGANPTVRTGAGNTTTIPLQGLPANTRALSAGQFMTVPLPSGHERLVMLTADLNTNGLGQGTASFTPALNEVPTAGTTVETIAPWMLVASADSRLGLKISDGVSGRAFDVEEAL